jgi:hypothetical protein
MAQQNVDDALFASAHSALVFAFNFSEQCYERPVMNKLAAPSVGSGKGLAGLDGAGQAGMVRAEVARLGKLAEAILFARIAPRWMPCACRAECCSGKKMNREWVEAISFLSDHVRNTALAGCSANGIMRREYVIRHFSPKDQRISLEDLADKHDVNRKTTFAHSAKVTKHLKAFEAVADAAIDEKLRAVGMVG